MRFCKNHGSNRAKAFWILVLLMLSGWACRPEPPRPQAQLGKMDLSSWKNWKDQALALDGQWHFSWLSLKPLPTRGLAQVPDTWHAFIPNQHWLQAQNGHATYELDITLPQPNQLWSLHIPPVHSSYRLLINGRFITQMGVPEPGPFMQPQTASRIVTFLVAGQALHLEIQVANYAFSTGGLWSSLHLSTPEVIRSQQLQQVTKSIFLFGCLLIMGIYHVVLFLLHTKDQSILYFGLLCAVTAVRELFAGEALFFEFWPQANWEWAMKLLFSSFSWAQLLLILYCQSMFAYFSKRIVRFTQVLTCLYFLLVLITPNHIYGPWLNALGLPFLLLCGYCLWIIGRAYRNQNAEAAYVLFGMAVLLLCFINDFLYQRAYIQSYFLLPFGLLLFLFSQSLILAFRTSHAFQEAEHLYLEVMASQQIQQDLLRKQQVAEQHQVLNELKDRFFANITHEFRTPLTLILSPVEQLLRTERKEILPAFERIKYNATKLLHLINQLLDLSKVEAQQMPVQVQPVEIVSFLTKRLDLFSEVAASQDIHLEFQSELTELTWVTDTHKLDHMVQNLLSNALKFTPQQGHIWLRLRLKDPQTLSIAIQDTGIGIAPEHLPYLFNRFYQVDSLASASNFSSGIGLSLAQEFAQLLGTQIQVSTQLGQGSRFAFELPLAFQAESPSTADPAPEPFTHPLPVWTRPTTVEAKEASQGSAAASILIVEDQEDLQEFLVEILSPHYKILTAANGLEGWQLCQEELPALVLSDVMMAPIDGYGLCKMIKETPLTQHIAVILLTAKIAMQSRLLGLRTGANDYLDKPFVPAELLLRIDNLLTYQQALREYHQSQLSKPASLTPGLPLMDQVKDPFLARVYSFIHLHLDDSSLTVEGIADHLAVSSRTLVRKITALTGLSTKELLQKYRLHQATLLLRQGYNVSETAYQVGFEDPSYFGQCFRELYHISPSDYAKA